jgi:hypothetical protein
MCDPFNTSTEAALWDERNDLDPFMAEHYATNAQHELDRALAASHPDQQHIAHVRRLLGSYHALAALAQLPEDSDFDNFEAQVTVESEGMACVHPDRLALMGSGSEETVALSSSPRGRSVVTNRRNGVVAGGEPERSRSRESSVESITREDGLGDHVQGQQDHANHNHGTQQRAPQQQSPEKQVPRQQAPQQWSSQQWSSQPMPPQQNFQPQVPLQQISQPWAPQQWAPPPVYHPLPPVYHPPPPQQTMGYYPPPQCMDYYQPPSQSMGYYQPPLQPMTPYQPPVQSMMPYQPPLYQPPIQLPVYQESNYPTMAPAIMQNTTRYPTPVNITINLGPTVIHQYGPNMSQPQQYGPVHGSYDGGYDEILGGRRTRRGRRSRRGR